MATTSTTGVRRTTRTRKTIVSSEDTPSVKAATPLVEDLKAYEDVFSELLRSINESKEEFMALQKEIAEVRESWSKEQQDHQRAIQERNQQEEIAKKRETETYTYETNLARKRAEDEFAAKKEKWERELQERKDKIVKEKQELELLRKQVAGFEQEKEKAVKEATTALQKELQGTFATERKLREQEVKAEKELLTLKITNLTQENTKLANEIVMFKKALEEATAQLKDVAVKVIESGSASLKTPVVAKDQVKEI